MRSIIDKIKLKGIYVFVIVILMCLLVIKINVINKNKIDNILTTDAYAYLPTEAKEYIKNYYETNGKIILTEKNKEKNKLYLNPIFINYLAESSEEQEKEAELPMALILDYSDISQNITDALPSSYDLRSVNGNNYVTPVRDQGKLGICWTFATAGAAESYLLTTAATNYNSNSTLISERQMDYATSYDGLKDYSSEYQLLFNRGLGDGGNFYIAAGAMASGVSAFNYNDFKAYNDTDLSQMELKDVLSYDDSKYEVNDTINMPYLNYNSMTKTTTNAEIKSSYLSEVKKNLMSYGAASISTFVGSSCMQYDFNLKKYVIDVDNNCSPTGGHAMEIIGWDDNAEYSYCADTAYHNSDLTNCKNIVKDKGVWILKNSWGSIVPYLYLTYNSNYTGINFIKNMTDSSTKNWQNNYVINNIKMKDYSNADITNQTFDLSNTKINNSEKIIKLKITGENSSASYNIKFKYEDGSYSKNYTTSIDEPGLITLDLSSENIIINKNTKIIIDGGENYFLNFIYLFTNNIDTTPSLSLENYNNTITSEQSIRLLSNTKNIDSGTQVTYKLFDEQGNDLTSKIKVENNIVAENNINTLITFLNTLGSGKYKIEALLNDNVLSSFILTYNAMAGSGTALDPYIITNPTQLNLIRENLTAYYALGNDIDLTTETRENGKYCNDYYSASDDMYTSCNGWLPIENFAGSLDGHGYTISGMYRNDYVLADKLYNNYYYYYHIVKSNGGLFGNLSGNVTIKNLILKDFDFSCNNSGTNCAFLANKWEDQNGKLDIENIALINNTLQNNGKDINSGLINEVYGYNNSLIQNIYSNSTINNSNGASIIYSVSGDLSIKNIESTGNYYGYTDKSAGIIQAFNSTKSLENVFSTINNNVGGLIVGNDTETLQGTIKNANVFDLYGNSKLYNVLPTNDKRIYTNINFYNSSTYNEFKNKDNYSTWDDFDNNWKMETIDGITRFPILKFVNIDYTKINDITINQELNKTYNINDYITPNIAAAKKVIIKSNDESIVTTDEKGNIIPQSSGTTTINVKSLYDGYEKDVPITINYSPHYTINYDANGGDGTKDSLEVSTSDNYTIENNPFTKQYYVFTGWNTVKDGTGNMYQEGSTLNALNDKDNITLYAQWKGKEINVTFDPNGGNSSVTSKKVYYGETYGELPIPTKDNCGFGSWKFTFENNAPVSIYSNSIVENGINDRTLLAEWIDNAYTINFNNNGGIGYMEHTYSNYNTNKSLPKNTFTKDNYNFVGWNTLENGTGETYTDEQTINISAVNNSLLNLYAMWEIKKSNVTFYANNGTNDRITQAIPYNTDTSLNKNTFNYESYTFVSWNTKKDGTGTSYTDEQIININSNLELFAIWKEDYTVNINDYKLDNNELQNITNSTNITTLKSKINVTPNLVIKIFDRSNIEKSDDKNIGTGDTIKIYYGSTIVREYISIVRADLNSDGLVSLADLSKLYNYYKGNIKMDDIYLTAADVNNDSKVSLADLSKLYNYYKKNINSI